MFWSRKSDNSRIRERMLQAPASREEEFGAWGHGDFPQQIPESLLSRTIQGDPYNFFFKRGNIKLWKKEDLLELFNFITAFNEKDQKIKLGLRQLWMITIVNGIGRITDLNEDEPERYSVELEDAIAWVENKGSNDENEHLFHVQVIEYWTGDSSWTFSNCLTWVVILSILGWALYGVFLLLRWVWISVFV